MTAAHLHPMIVHFPIALILAGFLADLLFIIFPREKAFQKTGLYLMILGTLGAIGGYLTGQFFTSHPTDGAIVDIFERHEILALSTLVVITVGTLLRIIFLVLKKDKPLFRWTVFGFYLAGAVLVSLTGLIGGIMVMDYMMGL